MFSISYLNLFVTNILGFICMLIPLLLSVAYFTLYERQVLAALQRRQGPNVVGFYGFLQPIADGLKLLIKESIFPKSANTLIFVFAPKNIRSNTSRRILNNFNIW